MQLETIYVLEGLGPPKEHAPGTKSFKDQVVLLLLVYAGLFSNLFARVQFGLRFYNLNQLSPCIH